MKIEDARIFFTGTGGTGKTSVLDILAQKFPNLKVLPSPARRVHKQFGITERDQINLSHERVFELQKEIFRVKYEEDMRPGGVISDRTLLCNYAYALQRSHTQISWPLLAEWEGCVEETLHTYDLLVYFPFPTPWTEEATDDGFRRTSYATWYGHDVILRQALFVQKGGYQYYPKAFLHVHPSLSPEQRARVISETVENEL
jgi:hypothetical protein